MEDMNIAEFEKFLAELDANITKLRTAAEREGNKQAASEADRYEPPARGRRPALLR